MFLLAYVFEPLYFLTIYSNKPQILEPTVYLLLMICVDWSEQNKGGVQL